MLLDGLMPFVYRKHDDFSDQRVPRLQGYSEYHLCDVGRIHDLRHITTMILFAIPQRSIHSPRIDAAHPDPLVLKLNGQASVNPFTAYLDVQYIT